MNSRLTEEFLRPQRRKYYYIPNVNIFLGSARVYSPAEETFKKDGIAFYSTLQSIMVLAYGMRKASSRLPSDLWKHIIEYVIGDSNFPTIARPTLLSFFDEIYKPKELTPIEALQRKYSASIKQQLAFFYYDTKEERTLLEEQVKQNIALPKS